MKNLFSPLYSLAAGALCALALGSCSRADYAMLPQSSSYLGTTRSVAVAPATSTTAAPAETATMPIAEVPESVASVAVAPAATENIAPKNSAAAPKAEPTNKAEEAALGATLPAATARVSEPAKMTRVQKFAASKVMRTLAKTAGVTQFKEKLDVAKTEKISGNLRTGIILLLIGLIVSLFSKINGIFGLIGTIIAIIGLVFIVLWLLDSI